MKKSSLFLPVLFFAGLFFNSCSSEKNMIIEKRHYGNGYYIHQSGNKHNETVSKTNSNNTATENVVANAFVVPNDKVASTTNSVAPINENVVVTTPVAKHNAAATQKPVQKIAAVQTNNVAVEKNVLKNHNNKIRATKKPAKNSTADDVNDIVLIILCLFLPPVAVLLHEGGLNSKFWLDLLLTLLLVLPGIIYAFIVCFG